MKSYNLFLVFFISIIYTFSISLISPKSSHAIVIIAPIVLIPLVKILAIILGGLAIPSATLGAIYAKLFKKSLLRAILSAFVILIILVVIIGIIIKLLYPEIPVFGIG